MAKKKTKTDNTPVTDSLLTSPLKVASRVIRGQIISSDFFTRHWLMILVIVTLILIYITNKYNCLRSMEEIRSLTIELERIETEAMRERSNYMSKITEQAMRSRLDSCDSTSEYKTSHHLNSPPNER